MQCKLRIEEIDEAEMETWYYQPCAEIKSSAAVCHAPTSFTHAEGSVKFCRTRCRPPFPPTCWDHCPSKPSAAASPCAHGACHSGAASCATYEHKRGNEDGRDCIPTRARHAAKSPPQSRLCPRGSPAVRPCCLPCEGGGPLWLSHQEHIPRAVKKLTGNC